ncbi:response regulator transcription factor [Candidatus Omnitrophota bacterium]
MAGDIKRKKKILAVDDDEKITQLIKAILENTGLYEVVIAHNGDEGLSKFHKEGPDLVISDVMMPGKNGFELLQELRKPGVKWRPVIMLTAVDDALKKAYDLEADFYLTKPFDSKVLLRGIQTLLPLISMRNPEQPEKSDKPDEIG